jgi:hypothetical protein
MTAIIHRLSPEQATDPEQVFREQLEHTITSRLVGAARAGWTPDDIRHVIGSVADLFLYAALPDVEASAPAAVRAAWLRQTHGPRSGEATIGELEAVAGQLFSLPTFQDTDLLTDLHLLHDRDLEAAGLSAEQRRAQQRITGLLKKAESTTFAAEAETLVAKAQQLRQRYRIDHLDPAGPGPGEVVSVRIRLRTPWVRQQFLLLGRVAHANSCRTVLERSVDIASLIGHPDDVRHTAELFASLNHQRDYFMRTSPGAHEATRTGQTSAYRRSFLYSYAVRIGDLLLDAADVPVTPAEKRDILPVLASRVDAARAATNRLFRHTRSMSFRHGHHPTGAVDGVRAAERSHLGPEGTGVEGGVEGTGTNPSPGPADR